MRHAFIATRFALAVAVTLSACDGPSEPTIPSASSEATDAAPQAATQVPFKGAFDGVGIAADVPGDRCAELTVRITGTGSATHLGRLTTDQSHCAATTSPAFTAGEFTFTAANGDQLRGTYFGTFVPQAPPLFAIDGHFTVTGGTGRFAGATGGGDASGVQNLATGAATVTLAGTISSVGASD